MKTWRLTRFLSIVLVLAMLLQMLPVQSFATTDSESFAAEAVTDQPDVSVLGEVEELREEDTKHFRLSDGSFIAVSYGIPVHYEDEDGSWQDIDNSLTMDSATSTYQLDHSDVAVSFSGTLSNGTLLSTSRNGASISMSLLDTEQALLMISGEKVFEDAEDPQATEPIETVPEEVFAPETIPEDVPEADVPDETFAEDVPEETEVVTETTEEASEETAEDVEPANEESIVSDVAEETPEDIPEDIVSDAFTEGVDAAASEVTESVEEPFDVPAVTEPEEAATSSVEETTAETVPVTIPEETVSAMLPEDTTTEEITEPTEGETVQDNADISLTDEKVYDRTVTAQVTENELTLLNLQEEHSWNVEDVIPQNLQSSLVYENVFPDTDLMYTAFGYNIKEQIIVNKPQQAYRYDFLLNLNGLTASLQEDGSVTFTNSEGEALYRIPIPYMEDESGVISPEVTFALSETAQGLVLTVEADAEWINDEERAFPVKIDPSFIITSGSALDDIYSVYTMEAAPNDTTLGRQYLYVGAQPYSTSNDGRYRLFMHFNDMPTIPAGSEVVSANLSLYQHQYVQRYCESFPIGVYEVTTELPSKYSSYYNWFAGMTWRNCMPSYDTSNCIDFVMVDATKGYRTWNITELVKKWYVEGTDNSTAALIMMNEDEIDTYYYFASATFYAYASTIPPTLIVSYRNNTGIEPYYTYDTLGCADAGTAYIADATGQLKVGKELVSYASSTNPFSLNLIYNSDYFALSSGTNYQPPSKLGLSMTLGSGWTLDCIQKVVPETIDSISYLKYTDGDGTIHYFMKDSTPADSNYPYYDEDGLGLKMKINSTNNYTMADDNGNEWIFTGNYLTSIKDSDGNRINISYSGGKLTSISQVNSGQSAITVATFTYSGSNLTSVEDAAGNTYTLTYSGTNLVSIKKNNTTISSYTYSGYRLNGMTDSESNYGLSFTYTHGKISSYKELGGSTAGATVAVTYPSQSQTTYRDYGADRTANTSDDILTHYLFDYAQRTANAYTTDNAGEILGATNSVYHQGSESIDKRNNRTVRTASVGLVSQQLLRNTGVESSPSWTTSGTTISSAKSRTGSKSICGTASSSGTQYAQKASESLTAGTTYTFSGFVNTSGITSFSGTGVYLKVSDSSGHSWESYPVNYATSNAVDNGWVRISVSFTAQSSGAHTVAVYNHGGVGTFYADDFQLEKGEAPSTHNLVENGSMQMSSYGWTMGSGAAYSTTKGVAGSSTSLRVRGTPTDRTTNAYQDVPLNLPGTQTYVLSGWVNANAVPDNDNNGESDLNSTSKECGLRATITYSDNSTELHYAPFNADLSNTWQFVSLTVVPRSPAKTVSKIRVTCAFEGNANKAYFDNISLVREAAQTMRYDTDGNLISVETPGMEKDTNTYSGGNLIKTVTGGNGTYKYTYDSTYKHRMTSVTNDLITQSMGYDGTGNVTTTTLSGSGGKSISTSAEYGGNGNRLTSMTDASGSEVTYGYGNSDAQMMSLPTSVTDPNGTVTTSAYDSHYRVTQTGIANTATVGYTYGSGNLTSVSRTNSAGSAQTYGFTYDSFGNMLSAKVGGSNLATYSYGSGNGLLGQQSYANGDTVSFTYDKLGRTKTVTFADGRVQTYVYNGEGSVHSITETGGDVTVTYLYTYDSLGRLISSEKKEGSTTVLRTHQTYNEYNQIAGQSWQLGNTAYSEIYTYNTADGSLNTMTTANGNTLTMGYDGLRRLSTVSGGPFNRSYTYRDISGTATTMQVSQLSYPNLGSGLSFGYTYDALGNIATYTAPGEGTVTYTYDNQGQLLKAQGDTTYTYTYDSVGNILSASDGTSTHSYTYGDANWKDLLTAFDGETITYDGVGNPISYYNGTRWAFGWENGRNLVSAASLSNSLSFAYDLNGLRTSKTVGNVTHDYFYASGKLLRETYGSNTLDFSYDANGTPYALKYNGTVYYYVTNLQGDVIRLVDSNGNAVASYEYDPYGKILSATGILAETNPIRYRGYYYDTETGLYYNSSRYFDPNLCRFINADRIISTRQNLLGINLFAYCFNNPINLMDSSGDFALEASLAALLTVAAIGVCAVGIAYCAAAIATQMLKSVSSATASLSKKTRARKEKTDETLPQQGLVTGDPSAPPVDAGKQGKHVPGHNNHDKSKSSWPEGQNGVQQTQEAWKNGTPDPKKPDGSVRIGTASDGTRVRVHIDKNNAIHGYPYNKIMGVLIGVVVSEIVGFNAREFLEVVWDQ